MRDIGSSQVGRLHRSIVFRHTLFYVGVFLLSEILVFGALYWSTLRVYEQRANESIRSDVGLIEQQFAGMSVSEMAQIITLRCIDEPGEYDHYILTTRNYVYIAGNVLEWPDGLSGNSPMVDVALGRDANGDPEIHRVQTLTLPSGHRVLVGRNLTELAKIRRLIGRAFLRILALTLLFGIGGGYAVSRIMASRLDRINRSSKGILYGDITRRMPITGTGDELDVLSRNLNLMLDRIEALMQGLRDVTDDIAHDMRKPISRMRSRIELALMGQNAEDHREVLARTIEEADEILAMFNALLTIATTESGTPRDHFEELDLTELAKSAVEIYEPLAEEAGLRLTLQADRPVRLYGNPHLITQALANLLDNAIKYAPGSGSVSVLASGDGDTAELSVADSGPGIPEGFRDRALDRFSRGDGSRSAPGSGLGLSLVRAVAQLHSGTVVLGDNNPGLHVTLTFPSRRL